jgi:hypothetical protein
MIRSIFNLCLQIDEPPSIACHQVDGDEPLEDRRAGKRRRTKAM